MTTYQDVIKMAHEPKRKLFTFKKFIIAMVVLIVMASFVLYFVHQKRVQDYNSRFILTSSVGVINAL